MATEQTNECANVYTHEPEKSVRVADGEILLASPSTFRCPISKPFAASDAGQRIVIPPAGADGAELVTTIAAYVSDSEVTLADAAEWGANQSNLSARFRLQKLTHTNSKTNPADSVNDALKSAAHADYAANISDPDWDKTNGWVRLGSTRTIDYPFGYYDPTGMTFIALHQLFPGRAVFARASLARRNSYVKPKGLLYFGIYNNHESGLEYAPGAPFALTGATIGEPAIGTSAQYLVIIETDQNYSIRSSIFSLPASPTETGFTAAVYNEFSWKPFAGALRYKIYRKLGAGNVFLLAGDSPAANFIDNNPADRVDTGSAFFPNPANARPAVSAYVSTSAGDLADLPVDGESDWTQMTVLIPFPSTINLGKFSDPVLRIGLTEACAIEIKDAVTDGTTLITSLAGQFTEAMEGKAFVLTDPLDSADPLEGTVSEFVSATEIVLSRAADWSSAGNVLEIADSAPHGILIDQIGAAHVEGEWAPHSEDGSSRPQSAASNPNGSTQGGGSEDDGGYIEIFPYRFNKGEY